MIDYCTILFDKNEVQLLRLHLNSLKHYAGDLFNFKISVPEDPAADEIFMGICEEFDAQVLIHPVYTQKLNNPGLRQSGFDCANRLDKLMQACTSEWVFLAQSDLVWTGNPMVKLEPLMMPAYGMLGIWPHGATVINRDVYSGCHHAFWPNGGWMGKVTPDGTHVQLIGCTEGGVRRIRCPGQTGKLVKVEGEKVGVLMPDECPRRNGNYIDIDGVDVGMLLRMEMQGYGFLFDYGGALPFYHHIGGASLHGVSGPDKDAIKLGISSKIASALEQYKEFA